MRRTDLAGSVLLGFAALAGAQAPQPASIAQALQQQQQLQPQQLQQQQVQQAQPTEGWDGRLPQQLSQGELKSPPRGYRQQVPQSYQQGFQQPYGPGPAPGERPGYGQPLPPGYAQGYGVPVLILPPLRYGVPLCPNRAPPYFAGGFKPRGPYSAWHGSALPLANDYGAGLGLGAGYGAGYGPQDPYAPDPRDCAPARSWNGDEGAARQFYIPPGRRH